MGTLVGDGSAGLSGAQRSVTAMSRWSALDKKLPAIDTIRELHVYDFDNTLFRTPLPNPTLWTSPTIGKLHSKETLFHGGWWHDSRILAATGEGLTKEESRAWSGWWNETIVQLVSLSMKQPDALTVLLTGRSEEGFAAIVKRMTKSRGLEFDLMGLKPAVGPENEQFSSTMQFKQIFLQTLVETYSTAQELRIYEDRPRHVTKFRDFFQAYNTKLRGLEAVAQTGGDAQPPRSQIKVSVIPVAETATTLDPVLEVAEVQNMINSHNDAIVTRNGSLAPGRRHERLVIKKTVFFTSYMVGPEDAERLITLAPIPADLPRKSLRLFGNSILICPRPAPPPILRKVGGLGSKIRWRVVGVACLDDSVWAASVRPVPDNTTYHSANQVPLVVLALRDNGRPADANRIRHWQPVPPEQAFEFDTTVGEKLILRIESDDGGDSEYDPSAPPKPAKRKHSTERDIPKGPREPSGHGRGFHNSSYQGRGGHGRGGVGGRGGGGSYRGGHRNPSRGSGKPSRGRGGGFGYRSLDDVEPRHGHGPAQAVEYDDHRQQD